MKIGTKVKIIAISKSCAWYEDRKDLIGKIGVLMYYNSDSWKGGFVSASIKLDIPIEIFNILDNKLFFFGVKIKEVKDDSNK